MLRAQKLVIGMNDRKMNDRQIGACGVIGVGAVILAVGAAGLIGNFSTGLASLGVPLIVMGTGLALAGASLIMEELEHSTLKRLHMVRLRYGRFRQIPFAAGMASFFVGIVLASLALGQMWKAQETQSPRPSMEQVTPNKIEQEMPQKKEKLREEKKGNAQNGGIRLAMPGKPSITNERVRTAALMIKARMAQRDMFSRGVANLPNVRIRA